MRPRPAQLNDDTNSSPIINFTYHLLNLLGFTGEEGDRIIRRDQDMPMFMCGQNTHAVADLCVFHPNAETVLLLVKEDCRPGSRRYHYTPRRNGGPTGEDPEAQLLAQAIAAFQMHNSTPPVETRVIPAIAMNGTSSVLYKFETTADWWKSTDVAVFAKSDEGVEFVLPVARPEMLREEGMSAVDNTILMHSGLLLRVKKPVSAMRVTKMSSKEASATISAYVTPVRMNVSTKKHNLLTISFSNKRPPQTALRLPRHKISYMKTLARQGIYRSQGGCK
jgi:hypothetical protein